MTRKGVPGIETVGNREEWPSEYWGWLDWEREEAYLAARNQKRQEREEAARETLGQEIGNTLPVTPPGPQLAPGFTLFPNPSRRAASARSRAVDKLLDQLGIGP